MGILIKNLYENPKNKLQTYFCIIERIGSHAMLKLGDTNVALFMDEKVYINESYKYTLKIIYKDVCEFIRQYSPQYLEKFTYTSLYKAIREKKIFLIHKTK